MASAPDRSPKTTLVKDGILQAFADRAQRQHDIAMVSIGALIGAVYGAVVTILSLHH